MLFFASLFFASAAGAEAPLSDRFSWLVGHWIQVRTTHPVVEEWRVVHPDMLQAQGFVMDSETGTRRPTETIVLLEMSGEVFYIAKARQNEFPVSFKLVSEAERRIIFENLQHDFPKRIEYSLIQDGRLQAFVSDGGERGFTLLLENHAFREEAIER